MHIKIYFRIAMNKQTTLTSFLQRSSKRSASFSSELSPKKSKKESPARSQSDVSNQVECDTNGSVSKKESPAKSLSDSLNKIKCVDGNLSKSPHEVRFEIMDWSKKYSVISRNIGLTWYPALSVEFNKPYFSELNNFVEGERKRGEVYPPAEKVWSWTQACSMSDVKVVILGQDPYHNPGQAHGLCFSVKIGVPVPPSLLNMYKELESDISGFTRPKHGYLIGWARQGVLLLNAVLTVTKNSPNSHKDKGWENLTNAVIKYLNDNYSGIVFILWGSYAQKKADFVNKEKHHILKSAHPSPLSASRGFFGCKHFSKCNEILGGIGKEPIDWTKLPPE